MNLGDFEFFKRFLRDKAGFQLNQDKTYLLESRLTPVAKKWNFSNASDLIPQIKLGQNTTLVQDVIDAMTTNETLFFRDDKPFKYMRSNVLPDIIQKRKSIKKLRIWSAACSTGQEAYSIGMILRETMPDIAEWKIEILGTDISQVVLEQARSGRYSQFEIQRGLPIQMAMKNFVKEGAQWKINDALRSMVKFETFNLMDKMEKLGTFDIILCRNVLIYFEEVVKKSVLTGLSKQLARDGYLFLGGSETVIGLAQNLSSVSECPGLYTLGKTEGLVGQTAPSVAPVNFQTKTVLNN